MLPVMWQNYIMHIMHCDAYYFTAGFRGVSGLVIIKVKLLGGVSYNIFRSFFIFVLTL